MNIKEALQNGIGQMITRLIIIASPFLFSGAVWAGKTIVELSAEKVLSAVERTNTRLDKLSEFIERHEDRLDTLESSGARESEAISNLKDRMNERGRK